MATKTFTFLLATALFGGVLGTVAVSSAQYNVQIHAGAECRPLSGGFWAPTLQGHLVNAHNTENMTVLCPLIRDNPDVAINEVRVVVNDQHNNADKYLQCKVTCFEDNDYTTSSSGTGYIASTNSPTTYTGYNTITISASDITEYNDGRCFLNCEIPDGDMTAFSEVVSYQADY